MSYAHWDVTEVHFVSLYLKCRWTKRKCTTTRKIWTKSLIESHHVPPLTVLLRQSVLREQSERDRESKKDYNFYSILTIYIYIYIYFLVRESMLNVHIYLVFSNWKPLFLEINRIRKLEMCKMSTNSFNTLIFDLCLVTYKLVLPRNSFHASHLKPFIQTLSRSQSPDF